MKFYFTLFCVLFVCIAHSQLLTWSPDFITEQTQNATITADATKGNQGLLNHAAGDVYVHIGIITSKDPNPGNGSMYNQRGQPRRIVFMPFLQELTSGHLPLRAAFGRFSK